MKKELKQIRFYVNDDDAEILERLTANTGQKDTWLATQLMHAALCAVEQSGNRLMLPLRFQIEGLSVAKEAPLPKRKAA